MATVKWVVGGRVQGVGFRPFVYRLAHGHGLSGMVRNGAGVVEIEARGDSVALDAFGVALFTDAPAIARPQLLERHASEKVDRSDDGFRILASCDGEVPRIHIPPDYFTCPDCLTELADPTNRRYRYPFINCTQCGPRYTLIHSLPYDRAATSMAGFALCSNCRCEYEDPLDRRFHAEPVACPVCGPQLSFVGKSKYLNDSDSSLAAAVAELRAGAIVAVKGIGGYHLLCDARNETAVARLRKRKSRPHKPLAVLFANDLFDLGQAAVIGPEHKAALRSSERPIVLVPLRKKHGLAPSINPCLAEIGALLPYSPLHHLLVEDFGGPLVATSANLSGEPVLTDGSEAECRLKLVADAWLHHDRPIERPVDDSVVRIIAGRTRPLRLGRGLSPMELELPQPLIRPLLAVGGHMKNTVTLAWENRAVVSPHIGELDSPRSLDLFERILDDMQRLYGVKAEAVVCDAHPTYASSRWAAAQTLPVHRIWHHHAHASAVAGEHPTIRHWLAFTWDGFGLGPDGTLWGGETLYGGSGHWERVGTLRSFRLPGGAQAGRELWRSAVAMCWESGIDCQFGEVLQKMNVDLVRRAWELNINCHRSSSAGRVFDAAAALVGQSLEASFEGQGPMYLEALAARAEVIEFVVLPQSQREDGLWITDWAPLLPILADKARTPADRAAFLHESLAQTILAQVRSFRTSQTIDAVALAGGVFQNTRLSERVLALLGAENIEAHMGEIIPCNDAGLSFGQVIEWTGKGR